MQYAVFSAPPGLAGRTLGDVAIGEDGKMYSVALDNSGEPCWICLEEDNMSSLIVSILRTIKWSATMALVSKDAKQQQGVGKDSQVQQPQQQGKRKKTAYNRHIGKVLRELSVSHPSMPRKERMRIAVNSWKDVKDKRESEPPPSPIVTVSTTSTSPLSETTVCHVKEKPEEGADRDAAKTVL
jgi:hypothetical protein